MTAKMVAFTEPYDALREALDTEPYWNIKEVNTGYDPRTETLVYQIMRGTDDLKMIWHIPARNFDMAETAAEGLKRDPVSFAKLVLFLSG